MNYDDDREGIFDGHNDTKYAKFIGVQKNVAALQLFIFFLPKRVASKLYEFEVEAEELFN